MKKNLILLIVALFAAVAVKAQITSAGYYRVMNYGHYKNAKKMAFCCVNNSKCNISTSAGTAQNFEAIALEYNEDVYRSNPAAIIYITNPTNTNCNLEAQGVSVRNLFNGQITLTGTQNSYTLMGSMSGQSAFLYSSTTENFGHYIVTTVGANDYKYWSIYPVDNNNDNFYFGVKPTIEANGKYYAPYYVSFPFRVNANTKGMKIYYVNNTTATTYELKEITGVVPAKTPVLIECSSKNSSDNRIDILLPTDQSVTSAQAITGNMLTGNFFFNMYMDPQTYPDSEKKFDKATMRVWDVENGKLVLSNRTTYLALNDFRRTNKYYCIKANSSYLNVGAGTGEIMYNADDVEKKTITFDTNGGSAVPAMQVPVGNKITPPTNPTKTGYTFIGWDPQLPEIMPGNDITVKAIWQANKYKVTYISDGKEYKSEEMEYGSAINKPTGLTKTGYTFNGWDKNDITIVPAEDVTFTAQWQINKYKVTFISQGITVKQDEQDYGSPITKPESPTKTGAEFIGWTPEVDATVPDHDVIYTAVFSDNEYTIVFDTDGGTAIEPITAKYGEAITRPSDPEKPYYDFAGWDKEIPTTMPIIGAEGLTIKALWTIKHDKEIAINAGWNWITFNVEAKQDVISILSSGNWESDDEIKDDKNAAMYAKTYNKWVGSLTRNAELNTNGMYKLKATTAQTLKVTGNVIIPENAPVTVKQNWNYICFTPIMDMEINEALSNYPAEEGDIIKSDDAFATYSASKGQWISNGSIDKLTAGNGYMLKRTSPRQATFVFPNEAKTIVTSAKAIKPAMLYSDNMNIIGNLDGIDLQENDSIIATVKGEKRGIAAVKEGMLLMTIAGDKQEQITISLVRNGNIVAQAANNIEFKGDDVIGSLSNPAAIIFCSSDNDNIVGSVTSIHTINGINTGTTVLSTLPAGTYIVTTENNGKTNVIKTTKK